ncbi:hypothetical protein [Clostridium sp. HBUAS56010]|uniref:hypothetical protein n=1 Tax=Clostridium sp. HBUAS56010 TaxID=2571127 RepID=UPI001178B342|nr:hypothetical protein [Clostridium sp. HBUAS56010]
MARRITAMPVEEIIIAFNDKEMVATFNMKAVSYMQQELFKSKKKKNSITEFGSLVLYGGIKANDPNFTIEEARALALTINPSSLNEIIEAYTESIGASAENELLDEAKKKILAQMITNLVK